MSWHADATLLRRYRSAELSDAHTASVEVHLTGCPVCRALAVSELHGSGVAARERVKQRLEARLDEPAWGRLGALLGRLPLTDGDVGLLRATLSLHGSWLAASVLALVFVAMASFGGPEGMGLAAFLITAPLVPLAGVAAAFGPRVDPTYETAMAAPMPAARIILVRTLAVTVPAVPVILALSTFLPGGALAFAWLLPAVGLATASLALGTVMPLHRAPVVLTALWVLAAMAGLVGAPRTSAEMFVQSFAAFQPTGQAVSAAVAVLSMALVVLRRVRFEIAR